ncbi:transcriptional regulator of arginine metabolism [Paenibacillus sp. JGP012]|jgi:transcriptional regulator of arginine metabolism|uniref:Arginine repressor n=1 Tax=Paenibacillus silvae TaxID=1325358 RepID=A0A2W6NKQ4_9BACL|nr:MULTISPECIES: transcriptional regulator ArgR [Paenibacillus]MBB6022852.1 transcriptional regulator of arginine metabolism [Paenibacillus sp. JGP012]MBU5352503.1 transcriptional regulator ArgR [Paenibacillus barcinonensis]MCK6077324.1 transcriptional regulator ArgR [Paenibacillus silvae]MCK6151562.1 transcriptional regulator ArgR [Paenibacillus silvae]MCK6270009.1 transcriptional regulator ArgR [Paenibacillus silvae]
MKGQRHIKIREIISQNEIETQDDLVEALRQSGFQVTQATVSRDIKELLLIKIPMDDGRYKYSLPTDQRYNPIQKLKRALVDNFLHIDHTNNLVVMKCLPGTANSIAALLDNIEWTEVMGTICGDDTILIICRTEENSVTVIERIMGYIA